MKKTTNKWIAFGCNLEEAKENKSTSKTAPKQQNTTKTLQTNKKQRTFNFENELRPKTVSDLAVHNKKLKEVEEWFQNHVLNPSKETKTASFLIISGPAGCGKTATVKVLCETNGITLSEWINPMDQHYEFINSNNQLGRFTEFLTESKWQSLFASEDAKKVVLVKDFPSIVSRNPADFHSVLEETYYKGNYPIIFICTNSFNNSTNLIQNLFPDAIRAKYKIPEIAFNACATTLLKNALKRAHNLVRDNPDLFKFPPLSVVEAIVATSMGDIRSAVNQYYFASLIGCSELPTSSAIINNTLKQSGNKRKRNQATSKVDSMIKDETLGLFHGLGRVLNPKFIEMNGVLKLDCNLQKLIDEFSTQPNIFVSFLFENYINYFGDVKDVFKASELLSFSQSFFDKWMERYDTPVLTLWITVLGLMLFNKHKLSKWNQIKGPVRVCKQRSTVCQENNLHPTDKFYYDIIVKNEPRILQEEKKTEAEFIIE